MGSNNWLRKAVGEWGSKARKLKSEKAKMSTENKKDIEHMLNEEDPTMLFAAHELITVDQWFEWHTTGRKTWTTNKNPLEQLGDKVFNYINPINGYVKIDEPLNKDGVWSLDIFADKTHIAVLWQEPKGFGIAYKDKCYGEGCDEVYSSLQDTFERIVQIIEED